MKVFDRLLLIFRKEYVLGLWVGCGAFLLLWYQPEAGYPTGILFLGLFYMGVFYYCGFLANSLFDASLEISYANEKRQVAEAVHSLGERVLLVSLLIGMALSLGLAVWLSLRIDSWVPFLLFFVGVVTGIGYSTPPLRWKVRGPFWHAISLSTSAFFLPTYLMISLLRGGFEPAVLGLSISYAILHYGLEVGNQMKDAPYDRMLGLVTLPFPSTSSNSLFGVGLLSMGIGLVVFFLWLILRPPVFLVGLVIVIELMVHAPAFHLYGRLIRSNPEANSDLADLRYARWQTLSMIGLLAIAAVLRLGQ